MQYRVFFLPLVALLSSCTTPQYNYRPVSQEISRPLLNSVITANVGDEMVNQGFYILREAIKLTKDIRIGVIGGSFTLTRGYYVKTGEDVNSSFYMPAEGREGGQVQRAALADPWEVIQLNRDGKKISVVTIYHYTATEIADGILRTTYPLLSDDSFQQTLIYSGKIGDKIKIGYREFSNNSARPAFSNDVDYDLSLSRIIGYKGARLEVIEATNECIKYRVLQNFNHTSR